MAAVKKDTRGPVYYIGCAVAVLIMFFFNKIVPTWGAVTEVGVGVIGVFLGSIIAIMFTKDTLWPSIVAIPALVFVGYYPNINTSISSVFGSNMVYGYFLITALISAMNDLGAGETIASLILTRKFFQKKPALLSYMFLMAFAIAVNFMNTVGTMLLAFPILDALLRQAGIKPQDKYAKFMNLGLFLAICLGYTFKTAIMPDFSFRFVYFEDALAGTGIHLQFGAYTVFLILLGFVYFALYVAAMKFVFKCDFGKLTNTDFREMPEIVEKAHFNKNQVIFLAAFFLFAVSGLAPSSWTFIKQIGQWGFLGLLCVLLFFLKRKDENGNKVMMFDLGKYLKTVPWSVGLSLGLFAAVGGALGSDAAGIKEWLVGTVGVALSDQGSWILALFCIIGSAVLTHAFNNSATMTIFAACVAPLCVTYTVNGTMDPALLLAAITIGAQSGFLTPAASGTAPILYSREGVDSKFLWTKGLFMEVMFIILEIVFYFLFVAIL